MARAHSRSSFAQPTSPVGCEFTRCARPDPATNSLSTLADGARAIYFGCETAAALRLARPVSDPPHE